MPVLEVRVSAVLVNLLLLLGLYYTIQEPSARAAPRPAPSLAEASGTCFGYSARLRLVRVDPGLAVRSPSIPQDIDWDLEITGSPGLGPAAQGIASIYAFASRIGSGELSRRDLGQLQWAGSGERLTQRGRVEVEALPGGFRDGDQGSLYAWIDLPAGAVELQGITFRLPAGAEQPETSVSQATPQATCHPSSQE
jgi:hypothetical protein